MQFSGFAVSVRGASHEDSGTPCQDSARVLITDKLAVAAVSDGHGSEKHCEWMYDEPISIDEFEWKPLDAENVTDLGSALTELAAKLSRNEFMKSPSLSFAPVMILMSDGYPTDNYEKGLDILSKNRWYSNGIKAAVAIGEDADHDILARFTGDPDSVVTAHNGEALAKLIKFVAVTSSQIGSRSVRLAESEEDMRTKQQSAAEQIREFADSDEISADIEAGW